MSNPITNNKVPELWPVPKAAKHIGLQPGQLRSMIHQGLIPAIRWPGGRRWYVDPVDLARIIADNKSLAG